MQRIDTSRKADIRYVIGSTGAGKSSYVKKEVAGDKRILIFDPDDEYGDIAGMVTVYNATDLLERVKAAKTSDLRIRLVAEGQKAFEFVCDVAFTWTNCTLIAEELADVTKPSFAPPAWGRVVRRGARKRNIRIFATTQRPANADKVIFTQATMIRTGLLGNDTDRKTVASEMDIPASEIGALDELDFLEYHKRGRHLYGGNLKNDIYKKIN
ncbi:helicase HerA domain-containing protein [Neptunicella sp. SCSIO 80796]|uniref:helicase HerA domain-containing protein n=1 Tax=Neptunicella plasticusilytica TaxID=3117012 RepID=UPI003A4DD7ED